MAPPEIPTPPDAAPRGPATPPRWHTLRVGWRLLLPALWMLLLVLAMAAAIGGGAVWLLRSEAGTVWLLSRLPGVEARGLEGALISERFAAERLAVRFNGGRISVAIDGLRAEGMVWAWRPEPGLWASLDATRLSARRVTIDTGPRSPRPLPLPGTLQPPIRVSVQEARVDELRVDELAPIRKLATRGTFGAAAAGGGREHRVDAGSFEWDRLRGEAQGRIGSTAPYPLQASATLAALAAPDEAPGPPEWSAQVQASGGLARIELAGTLRGLPRGQRKVEGEAPSLDLQASVVPLEDWPLAKLSARTQSLDLASLSSQAPRTRLSGTVDFATRALDAPVAAEIKLDNTLPGRWDEQRLPLKRIEASVSTRVDRRDVVDLQRLDLHFSGAQEAAGRAQGSGQWRGDTLRLSLQLDALRPKTLDTRAAAMTLSGPVELVLRGLPGAEPAPAAGSKPVVRLPSADAKGTLEGRLDAAPQTVTLSFDASASARLLELRALRAQAGPALATLSARAEHTAAGHWHLRSEGALTNFDPQPWWPGSVGSAWRQGPHRLSSTWSLDLQVPARLRSFEPLVLAQAVVGTGTVRVSDSTLAGVPLSARIDLGHKPGSPTAPSQVQGEVVLGGNRLTFDGQGDPMGPGTADRMRIELQGDSLVALAPLARLWPQSAEWAPRSGRVDASVALEGRWPDVRSVGRATAQQLQAGELSVGQGQAEWQIESASDRPLAVQLQGTAIEFARQRVEQLRADLRGTLRQHRLEATAALPINPPRALELAFGLALRSGTLARVQADGLWQGEGGGGRWNGRVLQLALGAWDGVGTTPVPGANWAEAKDLRAELQFEPQLGFTRLQASAGQMRVADSVTVRWDDVRVDLRGDVPAFELRAEVEPFELAPLLARSQPTMGWSGDLRLAARIELRAAEKLDAEVIFERRDGDLRLTDINGIVTPFGLTAVRATLSAHEGLWVARGNFAGRTIGDAKATLNLRPRPEQRWPRAETPIDGEIEAHVANLGIWSPWVPPGWRLSGVLRTQAKVMGRVGAPDYSGEVRADNVAARNLLQGVDLQGGEVRVALAGSTARIERFRIKGGDGTLDVTGNAQLGVTPSAQLQLDARHFRLLGRVDRQLIVSGSAKLGLGLDQLRLNGKFGIDEGLFDVSRRDAPDLDDDVNVRRGGAAASIEPDKPPEPPRSRRQTQVAVEIDLGDKLRVRGRGLDTLLHGKLSVGAAAGKLTVHGIVDATGGTYAAYGQKLEISRGRLVFGGEPGNPALDVLALRPNIDLQVGVDISGSLLTPRVRLYSSIDMSETDRLSWLVLGRATDGLGRADAALLQRAAIALLAGEGEAPTDALLRSLGIDELSVGRREGDVRETVISLGKQLSQRWYLGYERSVNATSGTFQLIYRIAQRFTLRAQSGQENSLDVLWTWRLQDKPAVPKSTASVPP